MKQVEKEPSLHLWRDAEEAIQRESVFWYTDHPQEQRIDRRSLEDAFKPSGNANLDGVREALAASRRMLDSARKHAEPGRIADVAARIRVRVKEEIRDLIERALHQQARYDIRRAKAEIAHWEEYVKHYTPKQSQPAPAPQPDRRLPREPEPEADENIPF